MNWLMWLILSWVACSTFYLGWGFAQIQFARDHGVKPDGSDYAALIIVTLLGPVAVGISLTSRTINRMGI